MSSRACVPWACLWKKGRVLSVQGACGPRTRRTCFVADASATLSQHHAMKEAATSRAPVAAMDEASDSRLLSAQSRAPEGMPARASTAPVVQGGGRGDQRRGTRGSTEGGRAAARGGDARTHQQSMHARQHRMGSEWGVTNRSPPHYTSGEAAEVATAEVAAAAAAGEVARRLSACRRKHERVRKPKSVPACVNPTV
eukprot:2513590-Pleurochrysis_carterae.AAC.2